MNPGLRGAFGHRTVGGITWTPGWTDNEWRMIAVAMSKCREPVPSPVDRPWWQTR